MRVRFTKKIKLLKLISLSIFLVFFSHEAITQELVASTSKSVPNDLCYSNNNFSNTLGIGKGVKHTRVKRWLSGKPAIVNIITVNPDLERFVIKPSYGTYSINSVRRVSDFVYAEKAIAGINASFFKPGSGIPIGASIVNGEVLTGPLYNRVVFGITANNKFKMEKIAISGEISIGESVTLPLVNINQPITRTDGFTVYTDRWGSRTPDTSIYQCHIVVENNKVQYIKQSSVLIPQNGYVIVGPRSLIPKNTINQFDSVSYKASLSPDDWNNIKYAVGGGPYLVKDGKMFIDKQRFSNKFLWGKAPRSAVGYTKAGVLILVTVDGRQEGTDGATLTELAQIMYELGAYNAMNLDGGSSTQMVYKGQLVSKPTVKGGSRVTNALVVIPDFRD